MDDTTDFINVGVRIRPLISRESCASNLKVISNNPRVLCVSDRQNFTFDYIFDGSANQEIIYNDAIKPMVKKFLLGHNCTVFAYGQTGTGKTYTMENTQNTRMEDMGIIIRTFKEIFERLDPDVEIYIEVSLYEIYNERVFDLLDEKKVPLQIKGFTVPGLKRIPVYNLLAAQQLFSVASKNRKTAGTLQNAKSSRSHAVYTLYCTVMAGDTIKSSKFNFVDLAGSESVRKTGSEGNTFHEGISINKGLFCIGQVINALCSNQKYIPYREAVITTILKDSLSKKNYITLIACVSSKQTDTTETLQTLDFARRVKKINSKLDIFFKKPLMDSSKYETPMKTLHPIQTSTVYRAPRHDLTAITQQPAINLSPIVRMCLQQIESKLSATVNMLVNETTRNLLRRSPRIKDLHQRLRETTTDENDESIVFKKRRISKQNQDRVLKDITVKTASFMENTAVTDDSKYCEKLKEQDQPPIFKIPSEIPVSVITSSPNVTTNYKKIAKKLGREQQSNCAELSQTFDSQVISPIMSVPVLRRSIRLRMKTPVTSMYEQGNTSCVSCVKASVGRKRGKQKQEMNFNVPIKKLSNQKVKQHYNHVLEMLNGGTFKNLISLQTIGTKTAQQILLYRELHGKFKRIEDIKDVLVRGNTYERFMKANFLV